MGTKPHGKSISFIIVSITAFTNDEAIKSCYEPGMVKVLNKPVNQDQIRDALKAYYF